MKVCSRCKVTQELSEFSLRSDRPGKHKSECKQCERDRAKERYARRGKHEPIDKKACTKCGEVKNADGFGKSTGHKDGLTSACKDCTKEGSRPAWLKKKYDITQNEYEDRLRSQGNCCAICRSNHNKTQLYTNFIIDHSHDTGNVRGLLCFSCNVALGLFNDTSEILKIAISYLGKTGLVEIAEAEVNVPVMESKFQRRRKNLLRRYGLTLERYQQIFDAQGGRCAICGSMDNKTTKSPFFNVDHSHRTGEVRGLLCDHCNMALGHLNDDPEILSRAIEYLEANK